MCRVLRVFMFVSVCVGGRIFLSECVWMCL